jgi:hypothetical protein
VGKFGTSAACQDDVATITSGLSHVETLLRHPVITNRMTDQKASVFRGTIVALHLSDEAILFRMGQI